MAWSTFFCSCVAVSCGAARAIWGRSPQKWSSGNSSSSSSRKRAGVAAGAAVPPHLETLWIDLRLIYREK